MTTKKVKADIYKGKVPNTLHEKRNAPGNLHEAAKEVLGSVIKGKMDYCRTGQMLTFQISDKRLFSNRIVQFPNSLLPNDFNPEKYEVTGTFEYRINVKEK